MKNESTFLHACAGQPTRHTPIWLMRQAGRFQQSYREVRAKVGFLELCKTPVLASKVTLNAVTELGVDAAIIFSDILLLPEAMGLKLEFTEGDGPLFHNPVREAKDMARLQETDSNVSLAFVMEAIDRTVGELPSEIPLIGFAGAPFTVAAYMIEGRSSRNFEQTKTMMLSDPVLWDRLMQQITRGTIDYLRAQVKAGARAVQVFDSWIGCLNATTYRHYVLPHMQRLFAELPQEIPSIYFGTGTGTFLSEFQKAGAQVIGVDFRIGLDTARDMLGATPVQGNLDPAVLFCSQEVIENEAQKVLQLAGEAPGHIFNLGHGILPKTPEEHVRHLVRFVHEQTAQ